MAFVLDDFELERICDRSADFCGLNCAKCEAFAANMRWHDGDYDDDDSDGDNDDDYSGWD